MRANCHESDKNQIFSFLKSENHTKIVNSGKCLDFNWQRWAGLYDCKKYGQLFDIIPGAHASLIKLADTVYCLSLYELDIYLIYKNCDPDNPNDNFFFS